MRAAMARIRPAWHTTVLRAATWAGGAARSLPGLAGAACVCVGLGMVYRPLSLLAAGGFLLLLDRRL